MPEIDWGQVAILAEDWPSIRALVALVAKMPCKNPLEVYVPGPNGEPQRGRSVSCITDADAEHCNPCLAAALDKKMGG